MSVWLQQQVEVATRGRGFYDCRPQVEALVAASGITTGICHLFLQHTSASLIFTENADPDVRRDLEAFFGRQIPEGNGCWKHSAEGIDDMPAHIRSMWTGTDHSVPIRASSLALGSWQGVYLWEHRLAAHKRQLLLTLNGTRQPEG